MSEEKRGQNSIVTEWESRLNISHTDPNFRSAIENELANETQETVNVTLHMLGLIKLKSKRIKLGPDEIPDWILNEK